MLLYTLEKIRINDSWYCKEGDTYHAFFLEYPADGDPTGMWTEQTCGHMSSKDLITWEYHGTVLAPVEGLWNDRGIATGSVAKHNGLWYMLYTGGSKHGRGGLAVAVSRDLMTWERVGDGPQVPTVVRYSIEYEGEELDCLPIADPYIYPTPIDGKFYIFINTHAADRAINKRGCTAIFRTEDFVTFEPYKAAVIEDCDRMETVCVWEHDGKYYMYAGIVTSIVDENDPQRIVGQKNANFVYTADSIDGPYINRGELTFPKEEAVGGKRPYIIKVITDPNGREVMLANVIPNGAVGPYGITYREDGGLEFYKLPEYEN